MRLLEGDAITMLKTVESESIQTCVTSPPYWGLRDYGVDGQLGLERTPEEYVARLVEIFREVRRTLRGDGTLWLNLGDSYAGSAGSSLKPKDLVGIPWMVAFALRSDGWWLRSDIIWSKPNPMPESITDRPTKSHEYVFLLAKSERYFYDAEASKEPVKAATAARYGYAFGGAKSEALVDADKDGMGVRTRVLGTRDVPTTRNRRSVWTVTTSPYKGAHFATYPPKLIRPCILAGSRPGDTVLDPFNGAGTTGLVAIGLRREYVGIDINPEYLRLTRERLALIPQELFPGEGDYS